VLTSAPRIRNLTVVDDSSGPVLLYTTQSGTSTSQLASYDKRRGVSAPTATNNVMPASVASILGFNGAAYVLGTTPGLAGTPTLWLYDAKTNKIDPLSDFPALSAPGSLTAWVEGSTRLAFLATRSVAGGQQPLISVSSAAGTWSTVDIPRVEPATRPELLTRVGVHLFFSATDVDRGQEPWYWQHN
jgi:hypothetical protein